MCPTTPGDAFGSWTFINNTGVPINIGLFWDGFLTDMFVNELPNYTKSTCKVVPDTSQMFPGLVPKGTVDSGTKLRRRLTLPELKDDAGHLLAPDTCQWSTYPPKVLHDLVITYSDKDAPFNQGDNLKHWETLAMNVAGVAVTIAGLALEPPTMGASTALVVIGLGLTAVAVGIDIAEDVMLSTFIGVDGARPYLCVVNGALLGRAKEDGSVEITDAKPITLQWLDTRTLDQGVLVSKAPA